MCHGRIDQSVGRFPFSNGSSRKKQNGSKPPGVESDFDKERKDIGWVQEPLVLSAIGPKPSFISSSLFPNSHVALSQVTVVFPWVDGLMMALVRQVELGIVWGFGSQPQPAFSHTVFFPHLTLGIRPLESRNLKNKDHCDDKTRLKDGFIESARKGWTKSGLLSSWIPENWFYVYTPPSITADHFDIPAPFYLIP